MFEFEIVICLWLIVMMIAFGLAYIGGKKNEVD